MSYAAGFSSSDAIIGEILRLIHENCAHSDLSLNLLARKVNVSSRHLGRLPLIARS